MADNVILTRIKHATGTSAEWAAKASTLFKGELGYDSSNNKVKIGNGTAKWADLPWLKADLADKATSATSARYATTATMAGSADAAATASYAYTAQLASTADYATNATSSSKAASATSATYSSTANYAKNAGTSTYASSADSASKATSATSARYATTATSADSASKATSATSARYATTATNAGSATNASTANYATSAGSANTATNASTAAYATSASSASKAASATSATYSSTANYSKDGAKATSATSARYATTAKNAGTASYSQNGAKAASATSATYSSTANYAKAVAAHEHSTLDGLDWIEFRPPSNAGHGGYLDFHFNGTTGDYTSRIIEMPSGEITINNTRFTWDSDNIQHYGTANGWTYFQFTSGWAMCWRLSDTKSTQFASPWGSLYCHDYLFTALAYPFTFTSRPYEFVNPYPVDTTSVTGDWWPYTGGHGTTTQTTTWSAIRPNKPSAAVSIRLAYFVIGRWK